MLSKFNTTMQALGVGAFALTLLSSGSSFAASSAQKSLEAHRANIAPSDALPQPVSSNDPLPTPPSPIAGHRPTVIKQAGVGGPVAYGRSGVLELGGGLSLAHASNDTQLAVTPQVGWFFADNFELSLIGSVNYSKSQEKTSLLINGLVEPSIHIPIVDNLFIFGGWGLGVAHNQSKRATGFAMAPRLGLNIPVGRSGILSPSASMLWSTNKTQETAEGVALALNSALNVNLTYSVMW